jgi:hypothetical protein
MNIKKKIFECFKNILRFKKVSFAITNVSFEPHEFPGSTHIKYFPIPTLGKNFRFSTNRGPRVSCLNDQISTQPLSGRKSWWLV